MNYTQFCKVKYNLKYYNILIGIFVLRPSTLEKYRNNSAAEREMRVRVEFCHMFVRKPYVKREFQNFRSFSNFHSPEHNGHRWEHGWNILEPNVQYTAASWTCTYRQIVTALSGGNHSLQTAKL